jgi:hypothetical protein
MLKRFVVLAIVSTVLAATVAIYVRVARVQSGELDGSTLTLSSEAAAANSRGELMVRYIVGGSFASVASLDEAFARYTVLVAQPTLNRSYVVDDISVVTWSKMTVSETLSQKPVYQCSGCDPVVMPDPPADLLPLNSNEILIYRAGGNAVVDGVTFTFEVEQFPDFNVGQNYLLFLNEDTSKSVATADIGSMGTFTLTSPNVFRSTLTDPNGAVIGNDVTDGMYYRFNNQLSLLRNFFNPPQSCDPTGANQASCIDDGGSWNAATCYCTPAFDPCVHKPWLCE